MGSRAASRALRGRAARGGPLAVLPGANPSAAVDLRYSTQTPIDHDPAKSTDPGTSLSFRPLSAAVVVGTTRHLSRGFSSTALDSRSDRTVEHSTDSSLAILAANPLASGVLGANPLQGGARVGGKSLLPAICQPGLSKGFAAGNAQAEASAAAADASTAADPRAAAAHSDRPEHENKGGDLEEGASKAQAALEARQRAVEAIREAARIEQEKEDKLFAELDKKRARNERAWHPPPGAAPTIRSRAVELYRGAKSGVVWFGSALLGAPGAVWRFVTLKPSDMKASMKNGWKHVKEEAHHYWVGSKLLYVEVGQASDLVWKLLQGKELSRREKAQLTRTTADIFRLVPMLVFVLVPFMEFLLPVALKLFPNMLPSTFEDKLKKEEELRKRLNLKIEVARFLQDTVAEMAKDIQRRNKGESAATAQQLYDFMGKVRAGEPVSNVELTKFAPLFNDELTLDNLERVQLQSMLTFVGLSPYGTEGFLKNRLRHHVAEIKDDDLEIKAEGVNTLTDTELREACRARGMRAHFGEHARQLMTRNLEEWLELSTSRNMPTSLLLLSRAFTVTTRTAAILEEQLCSTLGSLPDEVVENVSINSTTETSKSAELQRKLALVTAERERIAEERLEAQMEEEARQALHEMETRPAAEGIKDPAQRVDKQEMAIAAARAVVKEASAGFNRQSSEEKQAWMAKKREKHMQEIISALAVLASSSGISNERHFFMKLVKEQIKAMDDQVKTRGGKALTFRGGNLEASGPLPEDEIVTDISDKVTGILKRMEKELDMADEKISYKMKILDEDGDGIISEAELQQALGFLHRQMGEEDLRGILGHLNFTKDGTIKVETLVGLARKGVDEHEEQLAEKPGRSSEDSSMGQLVCDVESAKNLQLTSSR